MRRAPSPKRRRPTAPKQTFFRKGESAQGVAREAVRGNAAPPVLGEKGRKLLLPSEERLLLQKYEKESNAFRGREKRARLNLLNSKENAN